jgi:2-amino-4-hydroxy-6-hydroxymethyldihydropteridine diphosphokinase
LINSIPDRKGLVYLLLGTNLGDRRAHLKNALKAINEKLGTITISSHCYQTEPFEAENQDPYLNQVVGIIPFLEPKALMDKILEIEQDAGRTREAKNAARTLDIDILLWGEQIINKNNIIIPHPRLHLRNFALIPLMEIAGDLIHPGLKRSIEELFDACKDQNEVEILDERTDSI